MKRLLDRLAWWWLTGKPAYRFEIIARDNASETFQKIGRATQ